MRGSHWILLLSLSGCVSSGPGIRPLRPLELATAPYQPTVAEQLNGSLVYEGGCLLFREDQTNRLLLPVWPTGSIFNGSSVIFHEPGKADQPVVMAEQFVMGGTAVPWTQLAAAHYAPFQAQCRALPFLVSEVWPAD